MKEQNIETLNTEINNDISADDNKTEGLADKPVLKVKKII